MEVHRRDLLRAGAIGGLLLGTPFSMVACRTGDLPGYYLSADGDDSKSGTNSREAWHSVARLNQALGDGTIKYGDTVYFRCGDEFFGSIDSLPDNRVDSSGPTITLTSFGQGGRPKISGYKIVDRPEAWRNSGGDVWQIDLTDGESFTGNVSSGEVNTGFLSIDGVLHGAKKATLQDLVDQWDFTNDSQYLYVKSRALPNHIANDIRVAVKAILVTGFSGLRLHGLELVGSGGHGYRQTTADGTEVKDCRIHEIGGSYLEGTTRYGNGVELWIGSKNALIANNEIYDVYDTATTMQGPQENGQLGVSGCAFRSNTIWNCTQSFEYWGTGEDESPGAGFIDCSFTENVCVNGGYSWSYAVREDQAGKGNFLMAYNQQTPVDIHVNDNVFFNARDCYLFVNTNDYKLRSGYVLSQNTIALRPATLIQAQFPFTIEQSREWAAMTRQDADSRWTTVDPAVPNDRALEYVRTNLDALRTR